MGEALIFENLRRNANELSAWITTKKRIASLDVTNDEEKSMTLDKQLLKHETFVAELNFNATQLEIINKV